MEEQLAMHKRTLLLFLNRHLKYTKSGLYRHEVSNTSKMIPSVLFWKSCPTFFF